MKPMLCKKLDYDDADQLSNNWFLEHKYDGIRGVIKDGKLYDRRGHNITKKFPEFEGLKNVEGTYDGEIVAESGDFGDIASRTHLKDKFKIRLSKKLNPAVFMAFDAPDEEGQLEDRKQALRERETPEWLQIAPDYHIRELEDLWQDVLDRGEEGLIAKKKGSLYKEGKRSHDWLKIKAFRETKAVFTKYEDHNKGITIETDDGRRVTVNGTQSQEVRQIIEDDGHVIAEIQYLPQKDSDAWRFPSFRGIA